MHALTILHRCLDTFLTCVHRRRCETLFAAAAACVSGPRLTLTDIGKTGTDHVWDVVPCPPATQANAGTAARRLTISLPRLSDLTSVHLSAIADDLWTVTRDNGEVCEVPLSAIEGG